MMIGNVIDIDNEWWILYAFPKLCLHLSLADIINLLIIMTV